MNTNHWKPVLIASLLVTGSAQAFADSGWHYDEGTDTIIFDYSGGAPVLSTSSLENEIVEHIGPWYYDEGSDTIEINSEGSRDQYTRSTPSDHALGFEYDMAFLDQ